MKNMRKLLALLLALTLCVSLALPAAATENAGYTITGIEATGVAGETKTLQLEPAPAEGTTVTWSVGENDPAKISGNSITYTEQGTVTITASIATDDSNAEPVVVTTSVDVKRPALPVAKVTDCATDVIPDREPLNFALTFECTETSNAFYGDWYADFVLEINKTATFNASDPEADGYLAGQHDMFNRYNWLPVPDGEVTLEANHPLRIMAYAVSLMQGQVDNAEGLKLTYNDVLLLQKFNCGIYFNPDFLEANPDFQVKLALRMYNNLDESESYTIGREYIYTAQELFTAQIGDQPYLSLERAFAAANDGDTVTLLQDIKTGSNGATDTYQGAFNITKDITLNGNGHTITADDTFATGPSMFVVDGANAKFQNLTIDSNGKARHGINICNATVGMDTVTIKNSTKYGLVVNGSTVTANKLTTEGNEWGINVDSKSNYGPASLTIENATVKETVSVYVESTNDRTVAATLKDGSYQYVGSAEGKAAATMTIFGGTYANDVTNYCAENHKCVKLAENAYAVHKHELVFKKGRPANCTVAGIKDFYVCETCLLKYSDAEGKNEITDVMIPVDSNVHNYIEKPDAKYEKTPATCEEAAVFYKSCADCGVAHATETFDTGVLADHKMTHKDEIPAGTNALGTKEHWICSVCDEIFLDEAGIILVTSEEEMLLYPDNYAGNAEDITVIAALTEGVTKAITVKRDEQAYYSFTPTADGDYMFYLPSGEDAPALWFYEINEAGMFYLENSDFISNDINEGHVLTLKAGTKYIVCVSGAIEPYPASVQTSICVVKNGTVTGIAFTQESVELFAGVETASAGVIELPMGGELKDVTYTSSDAAIASIIKNGLGEAMISGNKAGTATITATTKDGRTATCKVTVKAIPKLKVGSVEPMKIPSIAGQFYTFKVPADGTYSLYWTQNVALEVEGYAIDMSQTPPTGSELVGKPIAAEGKYGFAYELKAGHDCTIVVINNTEKTVDDTIHLTMDSHTCKLTKVAAKAATYTEDGNIEYYICAACDKKFYDADGKKPVTGSVILPQLIEVVGEKAEVSTGAVDKAIEEAATSSDKKDVVLDLTHEEVVGEVVTPVTKTEIPAVAIEKVADADASLTLTKEDATVTMDTKALDMVAKAVKEEGATKVTLVVEEVKTEELNTKQQEAVKEVAQEKKVAKVISAELLVQTASGEKKIGTEAAGGFGGGTVTVKIPFTPEAGAKGTDYSVIYVADDGTTEAIPTAYKDGCLVIELEHFSDYVIVKNENPDDSNEGGIGESEVQPTEPSKPADTNKPATKPAPATGDNANLIGVTMLMVMSGLMAAALLTMRKKFHA